MASMTEPSPILTPGSSESAYPGNGSASAAQTDESLQRFVQGAHAAVDRMAEKAGPAVERLRSSLHGAADSLQSGAEELGVLQEKWVQGARAYVREHPLAAVGVAVVAGVVLSRLLASPRQ